MKENNNNKIVSVAITFSGSQSNTVTKNKRWEWLLNELHIKL